MIETNNLFEVSMGKVVDEYGNLDVASSQYYIKAIKFQNEMNEKLATNKSELMKYQAMYNSMFKSQGINKDASYFMSENLTKAGYDIASLYNLDISESMNKIKSGIAGQVESLRAIGIDVSENALTKVIRNAGITNRNVQQLSYAEKEVARYIAIVEQAKQAQGDFARTFEQPANQIKVFQNQLYELKQVAGAFIINTFGNILVYANAIIMVVKEILKSFAVLFGYDMGSSNATLSDSLGVDDLSSGLGTAGKKAKELRNQLMGFDEINNITLPSNKSGGSGGVATGVDNKLLQSLKEWDNKMGSISGKAQEIRDKIMDWLGFIKVIDPVTGEVSFKLREGWTNLKLILTVIKAIVGLYITKKVISLIGKLSNLWKLLKNLDMSTSNFGAGLNVLKKGIKGLTSFVKTGITHFNSYRKAGEGVTTALSKTGKEMSALIPTSVKLVGGLAGLVGSSALAYKSMEDLSNGSIGTAEAILKLTGSIAGATASGALLGSVFGPVGTILGGFCGFVTSAALSLQGYNNTSKELRDSIKENGKAIEESTKSIKNRTEALQNSINSGVAELEYLQKLTGELEELTNANGIVKAGYEDRVKFILSELNKAFGTEYELTKGRITQNGVLVKSIKEITDSIYGTIKAKKAEIILNANEKNYAEAMETEAIHYQQKEKAIKDCSQAQKEFTNVLEKYGLTMDDYTNNTYEYQKALMSYSNIWTQNLTNARKTYTDAQKQVHESTQNWTKDCQAITDYENLKTATITENEEEVEKILQNLTNSYQTESGRQLLTVKEQIGKEVELIEFKKQKILDTQGEINAETEILLNAGLVTLANKLREQTTTVESLTPENIEAWKKLAESSEKIYNEQISQIDGDTRLILDTINGKVDMTSPEYIERWRKMASDSKEKYDSVLLKLPEETKTKIQAIVNETNSEQEDVKTAYKSLAEGAVGAFAQINGYDSGKNLVLGIKRGVDDNKYRISDALKTVAKGAQTAFNMALGIHSPSRVMAEQAKFIPLGISKGIDEEANTVYSSIKKLSKGIQINTRDYMIDTSQYVDFGAINGNIQAQSNISLNSNVITGIGQACYSAFCQAMRDEGVKVDIEAKSDEGVVVKKVSQGFKEYVQRTGELPFPVPV